MDNVGEVVRGRCGICMRPYSEHTKRVAAAPICRNGRGVFREATEAELDAGYRAAFGDGPPQPIATFRLDDPASMEAARSVLSPEALRQFFGPSGSGMAGFTTAMETAGLAARASLIEGDRVSDTVDGRVPTAPGASRSATGAEQVVSAHAGDAPSRVARSLYSPQKGMIACVLLQAAFGGDRSPCHYFGGGDWETGFPDNTFGWVELPMNVWRIVGRMSRAERMAIFCDSDGNPKGRDGTAPSRSDDSAGPKDIAQNPSQVPHD